MDWDEIKRAQEAQRLLNDPSVREALKQQQRLRDAGFGLTRLSNQAALSKDALDRQPHTVNIKQLLEVIETLRRPLSPEWVQARQNFNERSV
jgi:hypothetical protein